jgi:hypothetical protein
MAQRLASTAGGNPRAVSVRISAATAKSLSGQIRHDMRRGPQPSYVDAARLGLNRIMIASETPSQMRKICEERRALRVTQRAMKSNSAIATCGIITFGAEAAALFSELSVNEQDAGFRSVADATARRLKTTLHSLVVHLDEATIHAHFILAAYDEDGNPIAKATSPKVLSELQDIAAAAMSEHCAGIERGTRYGDRLAAGADFADVIHKSVRELHVTLPADLEAKRLALADLARAETDATARVDDIEGRVTTLNAQAKLSQTNVDQLTTNEAELRAQLQDLEDKKLELKIALAEAERLADVAKTAQTEAERLAQVARNNRLKEEERSTAAQNRAAIVHDAISALVQEMNDGTITRTESGEISMLDPSRITQGFPELKPTAVAAANVTYALSAARAKEKALELREGMFKQKENALDKSLEASHLAAQRMEGILRTWTNDLGLVVPKEQKIYEAINALLSAVEDDNRARLAENENTQTSERENDSFSP